MTCIIPPTIFHPNTTMKLKDLFLRAMALSKWGMLLKNSGNGDPNAIWEIVSYDMAWVQEHWTENGCDLWEEVRSEDFYFNRMAYIYSLNVAADFADAIGQSGSAYRYIIKIL